MSKEKSFLEEMKEWSDNLSELFGKVQDVINSSKDPCDWSILKIRNKNNGIIRKVPPDLIKNKSVSGEADHEIFSVKKISSDEIFSVGCNIEYGNDLGNPSSVIHLGVVTKIEPLLLFPKQLVFTVVDKDGDNIIVGFKNIHLAKAKPNQEPNWKILKAHNTVAGIHEWSFSCINRGCEINSVKRVHDGEVFTIGDLIGWGDSALDYGIKIDLFREKEGVMEIGSSISETHLFSYYDISKAAKLYQVNQKAKQSKRMKVEDLWRHDWRRSDGAPIYKFVCNIAITEDKFSAIKEAIERVLNDDVGVKQMESNGWKCFRDDEFEKQIENAFNAARATEYKWKPISGYYKHDTLQDYLNSKSPKP